MTWWEWGFLMLYSYAFQMHNLFPEMLLDSKMVLSGWESDNGIIGKPLGISGKKWQVEDSFTKSKAYDHGGMKNLREDWFFEIPLQTRRDWPEVIQIPHSSQGDCKTVLFGGYRVLRDEGTLSLPKPWSPPFNRTLDSHYFLSNNFQKLIVNLFSDIRTFRLTIFFHNTGKTSFSI